MTITEITEESKLTTSCWRNHVVPVIFTGLPGRAGKSETDQSSGHWPCQKLEITQPIWDVCTANIFLLPVYFPFGIRRCWYPKDIPSCVTYLFLTVNFMSLVLSWRQKDSFRWKICCRLIPKLCEVVFINISIKKSEKLLPSIFSLLSRVKFST